MSLKSDQLEILLSVNEHDLTENDKCINFRCFCCHQLDFISFFFFFSVFHKDLPGTLSACQHQNRRSKVISRCQKSLLARNM